MFQVVLDPDKFGASWRVGGKRACTRLNEPPTRSIQCNQHMPQRKSRDKLCKPLRDKAFAPCHQQVNHLMYFK